MCSVESMVFPPFLLKYQANPPHPGGGGEVSSHSKFQPAYEKVGARWGP